jgi:hypothetical protein
MLGFKFAWGLMFDSSTVAVCMFAVQQWIIPANVMFGLIFDSP